MFTRQDYMTNKCTHRQFYAQFVNVNVKMAVMVAIGYKRLLMSKDEHLNDIPLWKWDALGGFAFRGSEMIRHPQTTSDIEPVDYNLLKQAGEGISSATMVCIYKEAAKQIIEEVKSLS